MQVRQLLKIFGRIDCHISVNNRLILNLKEDAMMFLGDSEHDKEIREMCLAEARKIKAESDQLLKDKEDLTNAVKQLSPLHKQILEMFYINGFKATVCSDILKCSLGQFYSWKKKAVQELERKMEENAHSNI